MFLKLLDTDEGARRLGEVALVPHGSPISQSNLLFYNTLFDENAARVILPLGNVIQSASRMEVSYRVRRSTSVVETVV